MEKVRFGVVGVGNMGSSHSRSLFGGLVKNATLAAICDIDENKLNNFKKEFGDGVAYFTDAEAMFKSGLVDCVIIATPHYYHPPLSIAALNAGLNVVCEKPEGVYTKQVKQLNEVAAKSDKIFAVMFNQRTNPSHIVLRDMVKEGKIGEVKRVNWIITNWYRTQSYYDSGAWRATWTGEGGGVLFNQCPHQLDLLQWIVGMTPSRVRAFCSFGKWHDIEVEDDVTAYMEFPNGASGCFVTCTADAPGTNRLEVLGTEGKLVYENNVITYWQLKQNEREFCKTAIGGFDQPEWTVQTVSVPQAEGSEHNRVLNNVANAILGTEPLYIDGKEGINGVALADAMLLSTWLDKTVDMPFDDELYLAELDKRRATSRRKETVKEQTFSLDNSFSDK
ncbi:MAG: Gfo/Idh/MocA family protein [Candidatus Neoclostridium sp.]